MPIGLRPGDAAWRSGRLGARRGIATARALTFVKPSAMVARTVVSMDLLDWVVPMLRGGAAQSRARTLRRTSCSASSPRSSSPARWRR
ncbi:MAG: hypothetical protein MZW92_28910 [Comamonadaceae bacterium]|nr:hypothetical protein [Comamonadaceae bacterium]